MCDIKQTLNTFFGVEFYGFGHIKYVSKVIEVINQTNKGWQVMLSTRWWSEVKWQVLICLCIYNLIKTRFWIHFHPKSESSCLCACEYLSLRLLICLLRPAWMVIWANMYTISLSYLCLQRNTLEPLLFTCKKR